MSTPLSKSLLEWFQYTVEREPELRNELNSALNNICKPCWELKYCPYGPLVEDFPLPPATLEVHRKHIEYLKKCLEVGKMGENYDVPLDEDRKNGFKKLFLMMMRAIALLNCPNSKKKHLVKSLDTYARHIL